MTSLRADHLGSTGALSRGGVPPSTTPARQVEQDWSLRRAVAQDNGVAHHSQPLSIYTYALGWPLEIDRHASESGVWLLQAGWNVSAGVQESPNINRTFALHVEQQVRELADCHDSEVRHREFVREPERSEARVSADSLHGDFDCVDQADRCCDVGLGDAVAAG
jgi:hypothetical protein